MDHFIEVKNISIDSSMDRTKTASYPESGMYISRSEDISDFIFVDKNVNDVRMICPESVYDRLDLVTKINLDETKVNEPEPAAPSGFVSEEFVMNFTKLLTGKK